MIKMNVLKKFVLFLFLFSLHNVYAKDKLWSSVDSVPFFSLPESSFLLYDNWQMRESFYVGMDGSSISRVGYKSTGWYDTTVPTTVLGTFVRHGVYPDPYVGLNNMRIPDASDEVNSKYDLNKYSHLPEKRNPWKFPYWFRTEFVVPRELKERVVTLNINGLNYRADIWINGEQIENSMNVVGMFRRFQFDVTDKLYVGEKNAIAVCIYPLDYPGNQFRAPLDGPFGSLGGPGGDGEILRNVTQYSTIGWDWVPSVRDRNMGIWQHVYLSSSGPVRVYDPVAFTDIAFPDSTKAYVNVRCMLENLSKTDRHVELVCKISPVGFDGDTIKFTRECMLSPNERKELNVSHEEVASLIMKNPKLWWPRNYGGQFLYKLSVDVLNEGKISSSASNKFGVRTVGTCVLPSGGRAFMVNNRIIRFNGGAWIPDFMLTWSAQRYRDEVRLMAEGNHSIVRINGCGIVAPDVFMDACDEYGLLVWQELSRTSVEASSKKEYSRTWTPPYVDAKIYLDNMKDCILRLRSHPSLIIWCGSNEAAPQSDIGMALQNEILPSLDGTRIWLPGSAETPSWSNIETRGWTGGPWDIKPMKEYYRLYAEDANFTFKNEIGLASPSNINSLVKAMPNYDKPVKEWFPFNQELSYHDAAGFTFKALNGLILNNLGNPSSLNEYLWMGNIFNNMAYRTIFEAANKARPLNAGTMLWKSNAAWPSFNWQVFDWFLRTNAGYYSMRSACKPLHVQASVDDMTIQVANFLNKDFIDLAVCIRVYSPNGILEATEKRNVSVKSDAITLAGSLPVVVKDGKLHFVSLHLVSDNRVLDSTDIWIQKDCKWNELLKMKLSELKVDDLKQEVEDEEIRYYFTVSNISNVPAVNVSMSLLSSLQGEEILPAFWSDNEFTLMPGDKKSFSVSVRKLAVQDENVHLNIEGLNLAPCSVNLKTKQVSGFKVEVKNVEVQKLDGKWILKCGLAQVGIGGNRINNWVLPVYIDGKLYRNVMSGISISRDSDNYLLLEGLLSGKHTLSVGDVHESFIIE